MSGFPAHDMKIKKYEDWRAHDQRYFVSDNTKLRNLNLWNPLIKFEDFVKNEIKSNKG